MCHLQDADDALGIRGGSCIGHYEECEDVGVGVLYIGMTCAACEELRGIRSTAREGKNLGGKDVTGERRKVRNLTLEETEFLSWIIHEKVERKRRERRGTEDFRMTFGQQDPHFATWRGDT